MAPKEDTTVMPASFIMMRGPAGHSGFSFGGHSYMPDENGVAMIPVGAVEIARSHGFHGAAEAERVDANAAALAKGAAIVNLKTKLVAMLNPAKCEHTTDGAYNLPESDTERAKSGSV